MRDPESTSKTKRQEEWENNSQGLEETVAYLDELCVEGDVLSAKRVLDSVWNTLGKDEKFINLLITDSKYLLLLPYFQFLLWKNDPSDIENGLDVAQGFLIKQNQDEAEKVINMLFEAVDSPIQALEMVRKDSRLDSLRVLCEERAVQYQARNSLKKKMGKPKLAETEQKPLPEGKSIEMADGYEIRKDKIYFNEKMVSVEGGLVNEFLVLQDGYAICPLPYAPDYRSPQEFKAYYEGRLITENIYMSTSGVVVLGGGYALIKNKAKNLYFKGRKLIETKEGEGPFKFHEKEGVLSVAEKTYKDGVEMHNEEKPKEERKSVKDLGQGYTREGKTILYKEEKVLGVDPKTFEVLENGYSTDNQWLFFEGKKTMIRFDVRKQVFACLEGSGCAIIDDKIVLENGKIKPIEIGGGYSKKNEKLYFGKSPIEGVDFKSFEVIKEKYGMDKKKMFYTHEELVAAVNRGEKVEVEDLAKTLVTQGKANEVFRSEFKKKIGKDVFDLILKSEEKDILYENAEKIPEWFVFEDIASPLNRLFQEGTLKEKKLIINIIGRIKDCKINKENFNLLLSGNPEEQDFLYTNIENISKLFECQNENKLINLLLEKGNLKQKKLVLSKLDKIENYRITERQYIEFIQTGAKIKQLIPLLFEITPRIISSVNKDKELSRLILENMEKMRGVNEALFLNTLNDAKLNRTYTQWGIGGRPGHFHIEAEISLKILSNLGCIEDIKGNIFKSKYFDLPSMSYSSAQQIFPELFRKIKKEDYQRMEKWLKDILKKNSKEVEDYKNLEKQAQEHDQGLAGVKRKPFAYLLESTESFYSNPYRESLKQKVVPQEMHPITKQEVEKFLNDWK